MKRREFIGGIGAYAVVGPRGTWGQQRGQIRHVGLIMPTAPNDPQWEPRRAAFLQGLQQSGWTPGRNVQLELRWTAGKPEDIRKYTSELVALAPDVIFAGGGPTLAALQQATRTIPIVFVNVADPVAAGFVQNLARPGGNITGFMNSEYGISGKWLDFLKQIAPSVTRVAVLRDLTNRSGLGQFGALQGAAPSFGVELFPIGMRDFSEIERDINAFAREANGGMIVPQGAAGAIYREPLIKLAARHRLPAVYSDRAFVADGGLLSYGPDRLDPFRRAAGYVDRILKGEKPSDLPVQAPTKYELAINLKTANVLGLKVPSPLLTSADEVIE